MVSTTIRNASSIAASTAAGARLMKRAERLASMRSKRNRSAVELIHAAASRDSTLRLTDACTGLLRGNSVLICVSLRAGPSIAVIPISELCFHARDFYDAAPAVVVCLHHRSEVG